VRSDQLIKNRFNDSNVVIMAPKWVKKGLKIIRQNLPNNTFIEVYDSNGKQSSHPIPDKLTLRLLLQIARNEAVNVVRSG
jgi:hypothetical protein